MKGKLVKCNHFYALQIDSDIIAVSLEKETEEHTVNYKHQLSLKNCEDIENGYDLDEMSKEETRKFLGHDVPENIMLFIAHSKMFQKSFQKALEILGNKKFSEDDVLKVVTHVLNELVLVDGFDKQYLFPESIYQETTTKCKSLQQTEWDCIIEMECVIGCENLILNGENSLCCGNKKPKLDENGCLILKRVE